MSNELTKDEIRKIESVITALEKARTHLSYVHLTLLGLIKDYTKTKIFQHLFVASGNLDELFKLMKKGVSE